MPAVVHAGALGRWHEELCRIKQLSLGSLFLNNGNLRPLALPRQGGVYCFWWTGKRDILSSEECNRFIELVGPGSRPVQLHIDDEWLGLSTDLPIPLYVGKTAGNLSKRAVDHLIMTQRRITPLFEGHKKQKRPTTSCQVRAGIEHLFPRMEDTRDIVLDNVGLSYVILDGDDHAANRFYLEDYAIGLMRPALNIDIER